MIEKRVHPSWLLEYEDKETPKNSEEYGENNKKHGKDGLVCPGVKENRLICD